MGLVTVSLEHVESTSKKAVRAVNFEARALREKCPNTEFFLVRIFSTSDWIRRDTEYLSVFSPNLGKYGTEKTPHLDIFTQWYHVYFFNYGNKYTLRSMAYLMWCHKIPS